MTSPKGMWGSHPLLVPSLQNAANARARVYSAISVLPSGSLFNQSNDSLFNSGLIDVILSMEGYSEE
jgi:hypothetical protein